MSALPPKADIARRHCHVRLCQKRTFVAVLTPFATALRSGWRSISARNCRSSYRVSTTTSGVRASRIWLPAGSVRRVSYRERLSEQTFYTWRKRYGWLSGRTGEGRGADVTRRQVNAPLRKLVEPYLAIEFVKKVTIKKIAVGLPRSQSWCHLRLGGRRPVGCSVARLFRPAQEEQQVAEKESPFARRIRPAALDRAPLTTPRVFQT